MSAPAIYANASRAPALPVVALAAAALIAAALAVQLRLGMMADVSWLIQCDERWLNGAVPYRDFIDVNPPASLLLYLAPVAVARALGLPSELLVSAFGFASAGAALALSALILRRAPRALLVSVAALIVLPGETFCERDHLAALFGVPLLAMALARAERLAPSFALAIVAGIGAGAMAAIKPPYAVIGMLLAGWLVRRIGWRAVVRAPEYYAAAAVGVAYVACVGPLFPEYVARVAPVAVAIYLPSRESFAALAASPGAMLFLLIGATAALTAGERATRPGFVVPALAAVGAAIAYFVQGKGWVYQAIPAMLFATLAGGFALEGQGRRGGALAVAGVVAAFVAPSLHNIGAALALGLAAGFAVEAALTRALVFDRETFAPFALVAAIGAACGLCTIERPQTPELERALGKFGPHVTLAALSEDMGLSFPLARRLKADWVLSNHSLYVTYAAREIESRNLGDVALKARLEPFAQAERKQFLDEIAAKQPDAVLVGPLGTALHADLWADPRVQATMAGYRRFAREARPGYSAELWLRKDFARLN